METYAGYDLIVAGGGPAGSACAITASRAGARVLLLEKDLLPRHKVCGEFVSAESLRLLESLLGHDGFSGRPEISSARIFLGRKVVSVPVSPAARSIPRFDLDFALLASARSSEVHVEEASAVLAVEPAGNGRFSVRTKNGGYMASAVVNATGRWSQLTRHRSPGSIKWIGLKAHFREKSPSPSVDLYFFSGGYCGVQPVGFETVNAAAMVRADVAQSMEQVLAAHPKLRQRSRDWEPLFTAITTSPLCFHPPETEDGGMMLVGDAAGFIDPFAGDGISLALHSGKLAADCLSGVWRGVHSLEAAHRIYTEQYREGFASAFRNAARLRRLLGAPSWIRTGLLRLMEFPSVAGLIVRETRAR